MKPWIQETRNGFNMSTEEIDRIYAEPVQGEQSIVVQLDLKSWALEKGLWNTDEPYNDMIVRHAIDRGWLQENFTGMEIVE
jgi:hypothetical protein